MLGNVMIIWYRGHCIPERWPLAETITHYTKVYLQILLKLNAAIHAIIATITYEQSFIGKVHMGAFNKKQCS